MIQEHKKRLRQEMRSRRLGFTGGVLAAKNLADVFLGSVTLAHGAVIATYAPFKGEIDPALIVEALRRKGHQISLPVMKGKGMPLDFRLYKSGDALAANAQGILEPKTDAPNADINVMLVPLVAFDSAHRRLGCGGGYYDRTIKIMRNRKNIRAIGIGFSFQETESVPVEAHDVVMDIIVTDKGVF